MFNGTMVYWLHGALHIYRAADGTTYKRVAPFPQNLLDLMGTDFHGVDMPLFVSEGFADDKQRTIRNSDYLSHAYTVLATDIRPLVIYGQGLDTNFDMHLVTAIRQAPTRPIAYGVFPTTQLEVNQRIADVAAFFPNAPIDFFDSTTHPLGH
jgi:hypothetical protein